MINYRKKKIDCATLAIFQDDKHGNNYLLFSVKAVVGNQVMTCSLDQSHIAL